MLRMRMMLALAMVVALVGFAGADIYDPCDTLDYLSVTDGTAAHFSIHEDSGPNGTGDSAVYLMTGTGTGHTMGWSQVAGYVVGENDAFSFDYKKVSAIMIGDMDVRFLDESLGIISSTHYDFTIDATDWTSYEISMAGIAGQTLGRIDFYFVQNGLHSQFDNLSVVPEPATLCLVASGIGMVMIRKRK